MEINRVIDYSALKPELTEQEVRTVLQRGIDNEYGAVCVRPCDIDMAVAMCKGTTTTPCCVLDFPHGTGGKETKVALTELYAKKGIKEIDIVMNFGYARGGQWDRLEDEIRAVCDTAHANGAIVKVIYEIGHLTDEQIAKTTEVCIAAGADFIKTCTGFHTPVTEQAVKIMHDTAAGRVKLKVSGPGIADLATAQKYLDLGADRLGLGFGFSDGILAEAKGEGPAAAKPANPSEY